MLSDNIKKLRKDIGLSQEEFAIRLNVVRQTVSKWENGLSAEMTPALTVSADIYMNINGMKQHHLKRCRQKKSGAFAGYP